MGFIRAVSMQDNSINIVIGTKNFVIVENVNVENVNVIKDTKENIVKKNLTKILCAKN